MPWTAGRSVLTQHVIWRCTSLKSSKKIWLWWRLTDHRPFRKLLNGLVVSDIGQNWFSVIHMKQSWIPDLSISGTNKNRHIRRYAIPPKYLNSDNAFWHNLDIYYGWIQLQNSSEYKIQSESSILCRRGSFCNNCKWVKNL